MEDTPLLLTDDAVVSGLVLLFCLFTLLAWGPSGVFRRELAMLQDLRNERNFNMNDARKSRLRPIIFLEYFLFFGLSLFWAAIPHPVETFAELYSFSGQSWLCLLLCLGFPLFWFLLHYFLYSWIDFLCGGDGRRTIFDRIYFAAHLLFGPLFLVFFAVVAGMGISPFWSSVLLTAIFIIEQSVIIINAFKIFFSGFGTICLFFVYLCALEIAPLAVIFAKMGQAIM